MIFFFARALTYTLVEGVEFSSKWNCRRFTLKWGFLNV
jgi:hypothetical protein